MYTDRTHKATNSVAFLRTISLATLAVGIAGTAFAQTGRLSSNPNDLRDAFAKHPASASSPKAFAGFVASNPVLGERYARHFGVPQDRIVSFFQNALVPQTLTRSQTMSTFGVTKSGSIYPVKTTLPAGTKVWATREGVPVLKWNCSNPLTSLLPGSTLTSAPLEVAQTASPVMPFSAPVLDMPGTMTSASSALPVLEDAGILAVAPSVPAPGFSFGVPATDVVGSAALPGLGEIIDAGGSSISDYWPALFIPVIFAATQGGGGETFTGETPPLGLPENSESTPPSDVVIPSSGPVIVPEGNTALLLLGGLPVLGIAYRIAGRRKK